MRLSTVSSTLRSSDCASSTITNASCSERPRMCVSGSTSSRPRATTSSTTLPRDDRAERVEDRLAPGVHLLALVAGQVAELLAAHGEQRTEDDDLPLLLPLEHRLEPRAQRERRLAGAGAPAERDDADLGVEQQVDRDALLGRAAVQPEDLAVAAHEPVLARRR